MFELEENLELQMSITIVGIGRKGVKAVSKMTHCIENVEFLLVSNDFAEIESLGASYRARFLDSIALDCVVGSDVSGGERLREDSIAEAVRDVDLVFIVTGMENQTVREMVSCFAQVSRDAGAFTMAVTVEGSGRDGTLSRLQGVTDFHQYSFDVDSNLVLSNDCLVPLNESHGVFSETGLADYLVRHAVGQIVRCLMEQSIVCLDLADIKVVFGDGDRTYMGLGLANGPTKGKDALLKAVQGLSRQGLNVARAVGLFTIVEGSTNMTMDDFDEVSRALIEVIPEDLNIIFGCNFDDALGENMRVTVFATFTN